MHLAARVPKMPCSVPGNGIDGLSPSGATAGQSAGGLANKTNLPDSVYWVQDLLRDMSPKCDHCEHCRVRRSTCQRLKAKEKGGPSGRPFINSQPS